MTSNHHVLCIGNAIVDVLAQVEETFITQESLTKGSMTLIDEERAVYLYSLIAEPVQRSGGSASNTAAGVAQLGGKAAYIGKVHQDELGAVFAQDLKGQGVTFDSLPSIHGPATAQSMIFITPDAERTMNTYLGACGHLTPDDVDEDLVKGAQVTYMEGYLWDRDQAKQAFRKAIDIAQAAGQKTSLSLSDSFCVDRFRVEFLGLIQGGKIDIVFANADEVCALYETSDLEAALVQLAKDCPLSAVTNSAEGCYILETSRTIHVPGEQVAKPVDTTGAGDLFAAGFLAAFTQGQSLQAAGAQGNRVAAQVIQQVGPRLP